MDETDIELGNRLLENGNIGGALAAFQRAVTLTPDAPAAHYGLGLALHAVGQPGAAAHAFSRTAELEPQNFSAYNNLGIALLAQGGRDAAIDAFQQSLALFPDNALAWCNLGNAHRDKDQPARAIEAYRRALSLDADYVKAKNNLGALFLAQGNPGEALSELRSAVALAPRFTEALNNLGLAEWQNGNLHEATRVFREAVATAPGFVDAYLNLSEVLKAQDRFDEARSVLAKARENAPEHLRVLGKLAALLEETGAAEEAENLTRRGLALQPDELFLNLTAAKCERRRGQFQAAIRRLERIKPLPADAELSGVVRKELGQLYDRIAEYSLAFENVHAGNELLTRDAVSRGVDAGDFLRENDSACLPVMDAAPQKLQSTGPPERLPVFLVGFPRSGTTLLNQVLDNHPRLQGLEEKPAVDAMVQAVLGTRDIPSLLADPQGLQRLRTAYFSVVDQNLERAPGTCLVDKYPLNILRMPLIYQVFPGAKVLLVLRHPCDACLSCYMQSFKLNSAMASFLSLQQTARLYVSAMQRWQWCVDNLRMNVHVVRYESLVDDFQKEVEEVLGFLGLQWDDAVSDFAESAKRRGRINTPSYHQVTQPIYRHALNRWRHYADHLRDILPLLTPFIHEFGYD